MSTRMIFDVDELWKVVVTKTACTGSSVVLCADNIDEQCADAGGWGTMGTTSRHYDNYLPQSSVCVGLPRGSVKNTVPHIT